MQHLSTERLLEFYNTWSAKLETATTRTDKKNALGMKEMFRQTLSNRNINMWNQSVMTLSFSQDVYTEMVQVQQAQIQALQNKIQELEARIDVLEQQSILFI